MEIMELLKKRRTYRRFEQKPVPENVKADIIEAARIANCGGNRQALKYIVIERPDDVKQVNSLVKWAAYLPAEEGTPKENETPTLFVGVLVDRKIAENADTDAGIAIGSMTAAAIAKNVGSCIMGAIDRTKILGYLGLSEDDYKLHSVIAFGYPTHKSNMVQVKEGNIKYYLDEERNYCVPKRSTEEILVKINNQEK